MKLSHHISSRTKSNSRLPLTIATLNKLKPAGVKLLLEDDDTTFFDYLRLTFADLLLKKVIDVEVLKKKAHPRDKRTQTYLIVKAGSNFHFYRPSRFEDDFISPLSTGKSLLLKVYMEYIFYDSPSDRIYKSGLVRQLHLKPYFYTGIQFRMFNQVSMNEQGKEFRHKIEAYILQLETHLHEWISNDQNRLKEALRVLGGNIFLIENLDRNTWNSICHIQQELSSDTVIDFNTEPDLQERAPSYYTKDVYPILDEFFSTAEHLIKYHGLLSGVTTDSSMF